MDQTPTANPNIPEASAPQAPVALRIFQFLVLVQAAILALYAVVAFTFSPQDVAEIGIAKSTIVLIASFQLAIVAGILFVVWAMNKRYAWAYWTTIMVLALDLLINFTAQGNLWQLIFTIVLLVLFVPQQKYFQRV